MKKLLRKLIAYFRLNMKVVCEESVNGHDFHDYPDSIAGEPWHFYEHECKRCGKKFHI